MTTKLILCGANDTGRNALAKDWCSTHKDYIHINNQELDIMRRKRITSEDLLSSLKTKDKTMFFDLQCHVMVEQNRRELATCEKSFISDGGLNPLVYVYERMGQEGLDRLLSMPVTTECLQRYRSSLVVVLCPLPAVIGEGSEKQQEQHQFVRDSFKLLSQYGISHVYMEVTGHQDQVAYLERALKGKILYHRGCSYQEKPKQVEKTLLRSQRSKGKITTSPISIPFLLPQPPPVRGVVSLRTLIISSQSIQCTFTPFEPGKTNRMVKRYGVDNLLLLDFKDYMLPASEVSSILQNGVWVGGNEYQFLGCSADGLKNRKCYMLRGSIENVENVWVECGKFSKIMSVSKRLKRIGILFSSARPTEVEVAPNNVVLVSDIECDKYNFTDGCGGVGSCLAKRILEGAGENPKLAEGERYIPSVFQIRFEGCKGVVVLEPKLEESKLLIRNSMKKFDSGTEPFREVWLCDYSKPYCYGHLNLQFIRLFSALGVPNEVFLLKQQEHFERLENMKKEPKAATDILLWKNQPDMAARAASIRSSEDFASDRHLQKVLSELHTKLVAKMEKLSILVPESRNVFGVCDPLGLLQYGECFFRPYIRGQPTTLSGKVLVAKSPCYLLGDVRVLTCIANDRVKGLEHLVDCIVFPTCGKRPHPMEIAGSDLDGDQYFICWDGDLIVPRLEEPYGYPSIEVPPSAMVRREELIDHFSQQRQSNMMGKIDALYSFWAETKGVESIECQQLGQLFSHSVDSAKTGTRVQIPKYLQKPKPSSCLHSVRSSVDEAVPEHVWKIMQKLAKDKKTEISCKIVASCFEVGFDEVVNEDFVYGLIEDKQLNMSEYKLFQFVERWCVGLAVSEEECARKLLELSEQINFGKFTVDQQKAAIDAGIPIAVVTNALNKSTLLSPDMMDHFSLCSAHYNWCFLFHLNSDQIRWDYLLRAVQDCSESLLVIQLSDGVIFGIHFLTKLEQGETHLPAGSVVVYFFSSHFGYKFRHILGSGFTLNLDSDVFQLYRGSIGQTFIWLKNANSQKSPVKAPQSMPSEEIICDRISVDLTKLKPPKDNHPKINKEAVLSIEVFVNDSRLSSFDIYEANQLSNLGEEVIYQLNELEELPSNDDTDNEEEVTTIPLEKEPYSLESALSNLQQCAAEGKCTQFLTFLQAILSGEVRDLKEHEDVFHSLQILLLSMGSKYACNTAPPKTIIDILQIIITSLHDYVQLPIQCLQLLNGLSRLQCPELVAQAKDLCMSSLRVSCLHDFLKAVTHWELWCSLPLTVSTDMVERIFACCQSVLNTHSHDIPSGIQSSDFLEVDTAQALTLQHLACSKETTTETDIVVVEKYVCYFARLILIQFVYEVASIKEQVSHDQYMVVADTQHSIVKLTAYEIESSSDNVHGDSRQQEDCLTRPKKVGFFRTKEFHSPMFTVGSYIIISAMSQSCPSVEIAVGQISQIVRNPPNIEVDVYGPVPHCLTKSASVRKGHWQIRQVGNVTTFKRAAKALASLVDCQKIPMKLLPLLVHPSAFFSEECCIHPSDVHTKTEPKLSSTSASSKSCSNSTVSCTASLDSHSQGDISLLNHSQLQAVEAAISQQLTLIHGPPGTGKTFVACNVVQRICSQGLLKSGEAILVTAETNMAVDNLTRQLLQMGLRVVRVGGKGQISGDILSSSLEQQIEMKHVELGKAKYKSHFPDSKVAKEILHGAQIVATTCAGAGDSLLIHSTLSFPFVIIDEATLVTEPVSLIAMVHGCQQLVLIGDPQQLSPTLPNPASADHSHELTVTLFHRMMRVLPPFFLEVQHRMHPQLACFPSTEFYSGKLKSKASLLHRHFQLIPGLNDNRAVFINITSKEERVGTSFRNLKEARVITDIVRYLLDSKVSPLELAVLTPYTGQVHCIRGVIACDACHINVCTVDSFQGRENDIIIFSTVRSNDRGMLGFTDDKFRMNVLLTRAKHYLIGVGCVKTLSHGSDLWKRWLDHVHIRDKELFSRDTIATAKPKGGGGGGGGIREGRGGRGGGREKEGGEGIGKEGGRGQERKRRQDDRARGEQRGIRKRGQGERGRATEGGSRRGYDEQGEHDGQTGGESRRGGAGIRDRTQSEGGRQGVQGQGQGDKSEVECGARPQRGRREWDRGETEQRGGRKWERGEIEQRSRREWSKGEREQRGRREWDRRESDRTEREQRSRQEWNRGEREQRGRREWERGETEQRSRCEWERGERERREQTAQRCKMKESWSGSGKRSDSDGKTQGSGHGRTGRKL